MLFLFYGSVLCIYGVVDVYIMAFKYNLGYISFLKLIPMQSGMFLNTDMLNHMMNKDKIAKAMEDVWN